MAINPPENDTSILTQLLEPLEECLTPELAQKIAALRASPEVQARIDELADKCNEEELTPEELAEYTSYVDAIDLITVFQAQARDVLANHPAA